MIVPSFLGAPWPGHLHPFMHRLMNEILPWFNSCDELASIPSSTLILFGRRQTYDKHRLFDRLRPALWLIGHSPLPKLAQSSELLGYLIPDSLCRYIHGIPPNSPDLHP